MSQQTDLSTIRYRDRRFALPTAPEVRLSELMGCRQVMWISIGASLGMAAVTFVLLSLVTAFFYQSDLIVPRVQSGSVNLGGQPLDVAATQLQQAWQQRTMTLVGGAETLTVDPAWLGITLDVEATVQAAHRQARSPVLLREWLTNDDPIDIPPVWRFDLSIAEANLQSLVPQITTPAVDATLQQAGSQIEAIPAQPGQTLNVAATLADLRQNTAQRLTEGRLTLVMQPLQPVVVDVSDAVAEARRRLVYQLDVPLYDPIRDEQLTWRVTLEDWATWIRFSIPPQTNNPRVEWSIDSDKVAAFIERQNQQLAPERYVKPEVALNKLLPILKQQSGEVRLRVYHQPQRYAVRPGESLSSIANRVGIPYPWIQAANPQIEGLSVGQVITIPSPDLLLPLPVVENKRIVVSISQQRVWVYEDGQEKWRWVGSTGIASSPTSPGIFQVQTHEENAYADNWDIWMPHFMGIYRPAPNIGFMNGFHGFPTRDGNQLLWTNNLGSPTTFGCILIGSEEAQALYEWAEPGVIVEIRR